MSSVSPPYIACRDAAIRWFLELGSPFFLGGWGGFLRRMRFWVECLGISDTCRFTSSKGSRLSLNSQHGITRATNPHIEAGALLSMLAGTVAVIPRDADLVHLTCCRFSFLLRTSVTSVCMNMLSWPRKLNPNKPEASNRLYS